jgi:hypothetical protein
MRGIVLLLAILLPAAAQDFTVRVLARHPLTNEGVATLAKAGFDELFIVERINTSRTHFDTSVEGMVALKQAGVSEDLISLMAAHDVRPYPYLVDAAPAPRVEPDKPVIERHWWGFRWRVIR